MVPSTPFVNHVNIKVEDDEIIGETYTLRRTAQNILEVKMKLSSEEVYRKFSFELGKGVFEILGACERVCLEHSILPNHTIFASEILRIMSKHNISALAANRGLEIFLNIGEVLR